MTSLTPDIVDLRSELLTIKKQFGDSKSENSILKVKIRRMQEELLRKNKELQVLLDPQKVINRRIMAEQGNSLILKFKDQIEDLKTQVLVRDFQIKKLQNRLITTRVYDKNAVILKSALDVARSVENLNENTKNNLNIYLNKPGDRYVEACSPSPISKFGYALSNLQRNILKIKQSCDGQDTKVCNTQYTSISPRDEKSAQAAAAAHNDMQDLTSYVMQMTLELEKLKTNFMQLQRDKFNMRRSKEYKSAEPKLGVKWQNPKLIMVQPKESTDAKSCNCATITETPTNKGNHLNGQFVVKTAFEEKSKCRPRPKARVARYQQTSNCGVREYTDDTDSVSEIIILEE